jgi:hypothetical protein
MRYLRQNTATIVTVGPFLDATNGVALETGLTITNERISFTVDLNEGSAPTLVLDNVTGATSGTANDLNYITGCDAGLMQLELAAANVNYVGRAFLTITDAANHCPVFHEFTIIPANIYDSLILGTDLIDASTAQFAGQTITCGAAVTVYAAVGMTAARMGYVDALQYLPSATAGAAGGLFIAGSNAATSITTALTANITGNVTGNLTGSVGSVTGAVGSVTGAVGSVTGAVGSVTAGVTIAAGGLTSIGTTVDASLAAINLDHLCGTATGIPTLPADTWLDTIRDDGTATFDRTTDSLQAIKDASVTAAALVDLVCDEPLSGHSTGGTVGAALTAAASAGDPWTTAIPGAYGAGTAGYIVGTNLNAAITSRLAPTTAARTLTVDAEGFVVLSDAVEHGGTTATLALRKISVANATANDPAVSIVATGTTNSHGIYVNSTNGHGFALGSTNSYGMSISSGAVTALQIAGAVSGHGISATGGAGGVGLNASLSTTTMAAIADAFLNRDMATGTDSGSATVRTVRSALRTLRNKITKTGGTLTVYKENDTDAAWAGTYTTANAYPIDSLDPASS